MTLLTVHPSPGTCSRECRPRRASWPPSKRRYHTPRCCPRTELVACLDSPLSAVCVPTPLPQGSCGCLGGGGPKIKETSELSKGARAVLDGLTQSKPEERLSVHAAVANEWMAAKV